MDSKVQDLRARIKHKIPQLTQAQKAIANYIVENPRKFALSSVRQLEQELQTSKSTIVRLAQALGYNGFHQLKTALLSGIKEDVEPIHRYKSMLSENIQQSNHLRRIADESIRNIHETLHLADAAHLTQAIELIERAGHVYTIGLGISSFLAEIAAYMLTRVSIQSNFLTSHSVTFAEQIVNFSQEDLILAFSFPPYTEETIEAAAYGLEKGLKIVSVTDKATSNIVQVSDVSLHVAVESVTVANSLTSALVLIYAIASQIGHDLKSRTLQTIEEIERLRRQHELKKGPTFS